MQTKFNPYNHTGRQEIVRPLNKHRGRPLSEIKRWAVPTIPVPENPRCVTGLFDDPEVVLRDEDDFGTAHKNMVRELNRRASESAEETTEEEEVA